MRESKQARGYLKLGNKTVLSALFIGAVLVASLGMTIAFALSGSGSSQTYFLVSPSVVGSGTCGGSLTYATVPSSGSYVVSGKGSSCWDTYFEYTSVPATVMTEDATLVMYFWGGGSAGLYVTLCDVTTGSSCTAELKTPGNGPAVSSSASSCSSPTEAVIDVPGTAQTFNSGDTIELFVTNTDSSNGFTLCTGGTYASFVTVNPLSTTTATSVSTTTATSISTTTATSVSTTTATSVSTTTVPPVSTTTATSVSTTTTTSVSTSLSTSTQTDTVTSLTTLPVTTTATVTSVSTTVSTSPTTTTTTTTTPTTTTATATTTTTTTTPSTATATVHRTATSTETFVQPPVTTTRTTTSYSTVTQPSASASTVTYTSTATQSQPTSGYVLVYVYTSGGTPIGGTQVSLTGSSTQTADTNSGGEAQFSGLPLGTTYTASATVGGTHLSAPVLLTPSNSQATVVLEPTTAGASLLDYGLLAGFVLVAVAALLLLRRRSK